MIVIPRYNVSIPTNTALWITNNQVRASLRTGLIVLEYRTNNQFAGIEVLDVRPYEPNNNLQTNVGAFLSSVQTFSNSTKPYVSRGLTNTANPYFAYQYSVAGDTNDGVIFATRSTASSGDIEVFWQRRGLAGVIWPFEMDQYTATWPLDFDTISRRIYHTEHSDGGRTKAPFVKISGADVPRVVIHYNLDF